MLAEHVHLQQLVGQLYTSSGFTIFAGLARSLQGRQMADGVHGGLYADVMQLAWPHLPSLCMCIFASPDLASCRS